MVTKDNQTFLGLLEQEENTRKSSESELKYSYLCYHLQIKLVNTREFPTVSE